MKHRMLAVLAFSLLCEQYSLAQNVGIGTTTPIQPLEVKSVGVAHLLKLDGPSGMFVSLNENGLYRGYLGSFAGNAEDVDFGTGVGNTTGKLHLTIRANPRLTIDDAGNVGIGTSNPQWRLDVNGNMQLLGRLLVGGSSGAAGQVLTSNGLSAPSWQTLSGGGNNDVRFAASFGTAPAPNDLCPLIIPARYNLAPSDVSITTDGITVNRSGLYHLDVFVKASIFYSTPPTFSPLFGFWIFTGPPSYRVVDEAVMDPYQYSGSSNAFYYSGKHTLDVYISAGSVIRPYQTFGISAGNSRTVLGYIAGYLISD